MEPSHLIWRKATYSTTNGGACVEVASGLSGAVAVRDSKNPGGPVLALSPSEWATLTARVQATV